MNQRPPKDMRQEVDSNANDLREAVTTDEDIKFIINQTSVYDELLIKRHLVENNNDVSSTIISLLDLGFKNVQEQKETTIFHEIRKILNEKELIYQQVMKAGKNQNST
jgi:hypothetical protein